MPDGGLFRQLRGDIPSDLTSTSHIEINDSRELIADGCRGILLCDENQIKLNMGRNVLLITGTDLVVSAMFGRSVRICGRMISVEFI